MKAKSCILVALTSFVFLFTASATAQTTAFKYQGSLTDGGNPANGSFQMQFKLFDAVSGGVQVGSTLNDVAVSATNGTFSVSLDFGASVFGGANRWIEIAVRHNSGESYVTLSPREQIASSPYAVRTLSAATADTATTATNFSGALAGDVTGTQAATTVGRLRGRQVSNAAPSDTQVLKYTSATSQWAPGADACESPCTTAVFNATQQFNINGGRVLSNPGTNNLFAGAGSGITNTGADNSFFGTSAGASNTTGPQNSFFGARAGSLNSVGELNSFFGVEAGANNTGGQNTFIGSRAGHGNVSGALNTALGTDAGFNANNLVNAAAIGANARVGASDRMVLGTSASTNVVIGNDGAGTGLLQSNARLNIFGGTPWTSAGWKSALKLENAAAIGWDANVGTTYGIGASGGALYFFRAFQPVGNTNSSAQYDMLITEGGRVGIGFTNLASTPQQLLHVNGRARIGSIPLEASVAQVCFNAAGDLLNCGASSLKLKSNIHPFTLGLDTISRLRPINFNWKEGGAADIGLGAEDVAVVAPQLTLRDADGNVAGVKYDKLNVVLINAIKEQQQQIEALRAELKEQKKVISRMQARRPRATRSRR